MGKSMAIREYVPSDLVALTELMAELGYPVTAEAMNRRMENLKSYKTFVAEIDRCVAGMIGLHTILNYESDDLVTHIVCFVTKPEFRGRGAGKALMEHAEQWAETNGSQVLYLTSGIKEERKRAHAFYEKYGFEATGYRFIKKISAT